MKHSIEKPASKRDPVNLQNCAKMARIIEQMEPACLRAFGVRSASELRWGWDQEPRPWDIPEIERFIFGSIELGFVLGDYVQGELVGLKDINRDPQGTVGRMGLSELRWYIHTVQRANKWADCYSSPILECLASGALQLAGRRLAELSKEKSMARERPKVSQTKQDEDSWDMGKEETPSSSAYKHSQKSVQRPDAGVEAQFSNKKAPKTYRYDSSLAPELCWDENPERPFAEWLLNLVAEAA